MGTANAIRQVAAQPASVSPDPEISWLDSLLARTSEYPSDPPPVGRDYVRGIVALRREQIEAAEELVQRRYAWRGYEISRAAVAPLVTLLAQSDENVLGTLTVRPGGGYGLFAEKSYAAEIDKLRNKGRRVGELVRLAIEEGANWRQALEALVRSAYVITRFMYALTDVVIEVNPRHVRFYQRIFGFAIGGTERFCSRVGAPSVLLLLDLEQFGKRIQELKL